MPRIWDRGTSPHGTVKASFALMTVLHARCPAWSGYEIVPQCHRIFGVLHHCRPRSLVRESNGGQPFGVRMESISFHHLRCSTYAELSLDTMNVSDSSFKQLDDLTVENSRDIQGGRSRPPMVMLNVKSRVCKRGLRLRSGGSGKRQRRTMAKGLLAYVAWMDRGKTHEKHIRFEVVPNGGLSTITFALRRFHSK